MPDLIPQTDYAEVRALIDITLSPASLPDAIIALDSYKGAAQREVEAQTSDTQAHAKLAARLICAALLAPRVPQLTRESLPGASYDRKPYDIDLLVAELRTRALDEIGLANGTTTDAQIEATMPPFFTVASRCQ